MRCKQFFFLLLLACSIQPLSANLSNLKEIVLNKYEKFIKERNQQKLFEGAETGNLSLIEKALEKGASLENTDKSGRLAHIVAIWNGHEKLAFDLVEKNKKLIDSTDDYGNNLVTAASSHKRNKFLKKILKKIDGINIEKGSIFSPVGWACSNYNYEGLEILLDNGADVDSYESEGLQRTHLYEACLLNKKNIIEILLRFNADPLKQDIYGETPLDVAITKGVELQLILKMLSPKLDQTELIEKAADANHFDLFSYLFDKGARPSRDFKPKLAAPFFTPKGKNYYKIVEILKKSRAEKR